MKKLIIFLFILSLIIVGVCALWFFNSVKPVNEVSQEELKYDIDLSRSFDGEVYINIDNDNLLKLLGEQLFPDTSVRGKIEGQEIVLYVKTNMISWVRVIMSAEDGRLVTKSVTFAYLPLGNKYVENINERINRMFEKDAIFEYSTLDKVWLKDGTNEIVLKAEQLTNE